MDENKILLDVKHLCTSFFTPAGEVKAVNDVSYYVCEQEIVAVVGESGSGKSVTQMSVMQLVQTPPGRIFGGKVLFEGQNLLAYKPNSKQMQAIRGAQIAMIFQEPMTSLNPVYTVGNQITEVIRRHKKCSRREAWRLGTAALDSVGIPDPETRMKNYPFEMSGGMRQRVLIAIAVACNSKLIIADEPTTALDVTTQAQVMELLLRIVQDMKKSIVVVTHNLGLVTRYAQRIYVIVRRAYCGERYHRRYSDTAGAPLHYGAFEIRAEVGETRRRQTGTHRGRAAQPELLARLLRFCSPLPLCLSRVP